MGMEKKNFGYAKKSRRKKVRLQLGMIPLSPPSKSAHKSSHRVTRQAFKQLVI